MKNQTPTINIFEKAARKAGKSLIRDFGETEKLQIQSKKLGDFVTKADLKAETEILDFKNESPETLIVCGGYLTAAANVILRRTKVDVCVNGNGEIVWVNILNHLKNYKKINKS